MQFDKYKVLETINQWIFNCDTKVSILLATYSVGLSVIFSTNIANAIINIIRCVLADKTPCNMIFLSLLILAFILICFGIFKLICVLMPTINLKHTSVMFFGNIAAHKSFEDYMLSISVNNDSKIIEEDLLHQIYAASKICNKKFRSYKTGIFFSSVGLALVIFWLLIGFLVYYI